MMVMRMVSLGFDLEPTFAKDGEKRPPKVPALPSFMEYLGYCLFPSTSVFGPFLVFSEHIRFLDPSPIVSTTNLMYDAGHLCSCPDIGHVQCLHLIMSRILSVQSKVLFLILQSSSWLMSIVRAWLGAMVCLATSSCIMPFLFNEPKWNK